MVVGIDRRIKLNEIIENQLPSFLVDDFPIATDFFKQYYLSQEFQGGSIDLISNFDQYLKVDNLVPEVIFGKTTLTSSVSLSDTTINVLSTKGYPDTYGLLKIDDEIITYTGKTDTTFTGCIRGFSGVTGYNVGISSFFNNINKDTLIFESTKADTHISDGVVTNLSVLFLQEFYRKLKKTFLPGLEDNDFHESIDVGNFIKHARSFYQSKGIQESIRILFKLLYGVDATIVDLEDRLIKPSSSEFIRREVIIADLLTLDLDPSKLVGQTIYKSTDPLTYASVSEVEILTRDNKPYYKLSLFVGFDDRDLIEGTFTIPGKTKSLDQVPVGSSIISVDSTVGFAKSGILINEGTNGSKNIITYTSKSINQFFGCSGVNNIVGISSDLRSDEVIYGYADGNIEEKVELRITGVLSDFKIISDVSLIQEDERIYVKNVGESIKSISKYPYTFIDTDATYKEIFANSWIYNTKSRYQINSINGSTFTLGSSIDKSSLKLNDNVDVLKRNSNTVVANAVVDSIVDENSITLAGSGLPSSSSPLTTEYDIRRNIRKASSNDIELIHGNNNIISDVLNVYVDGDKEGYVASNSLPSYTLNNININSSTIPNGSYEIIVEKHEVDGTYHTIKIDNPIKFLTGDSIIYRSHGTDLDGLTSGENYYVEVLSSTETDAEIRLYRSRGQVGNKTQSIGLGTDSVATGPHEFILSDHYDKTTGFGKKLAPNQILRRFRLDHEPVNSGENNIPLNNVGVLIDGVQIRSPISNNYVYYGPLTSVDTFNSGDEYDIINPPRLTIESPVGSGSTAYIEPIVSGSVKEVFVDPHDFDIDRVVSLSLTGGNGSGCRLEPIVGQRFRELDFDSRDVFFAGGISKENETITFKKDHYLTNGEAIYYNSNGNAEIGVGPAYDVTNTPTGTLSNGAPYNVRVVNSKTITLYKNYSDAMSGINTIGISTATTASGIHKFRTNSKNVLKSIKVIESGSDYQYRKLNVNPSGISTTFDSINFTNHGFNNGDIVEYSPTVGIGSTYPKAIDGLTANNSYYIMKLDSNSFRIADGKDNYDRGDYVGLGSTGTGYQTFKYPDIKVHIDVAYASTITGSYENILTPVVTGSIIDTYLYDNGVGYGSSILNLEKNPIVTIENGKGAELKPSVVDGKIVDVQVLNKGSEYYSSPKIVVETTGITTTGVFGNGAVIRPVISDGKLIDVVIVNSGIGYTSGSVNVYSESRGLNALFESRVRRLTVDTKKKESEYSLNSEGSDSVYLSLIGYNQNISDAFDDDGTKHSPIIGWAYDGNPIYGPYGYANPDNTSSVGIVTSGYLLDSSKVFNRPSFKYPNNVDIFPEGFFIEDYQYEDIGDLDSHNGRFCKTPEFPNGTYAYFAGISTNASTGAIDSSYPYFVGNTYRSEFISTDTTLTHDFDFNNTDIVRNTFPYKVGDEFANNDYIVESNETVRQLTKVESVTSGVVDFLQVLDGGDGYKVGDYTVFDNEKTNGMGVRGEVHSIAGIGVSSIDTQLETSENAVFLWDSENTVIADYTPFIELNDQDTVSISGLSSSIVHLTDSFKVGISTNVIGLAKTMSVNSLVNGVVEDIYVNIIPNTVSIGSSLKINDIETVKVLNIYDMGSILRVKRYGVGAAHTYSSKIDVLNRSVTIPVKTKEFKSKVNDLIYFNGHQSVGLGTTVGGGISVDYTIGEVTKTVPIPTRTIYLPNHPFKTGQKLTLRKKGTATSFIVGDTQHPTNLFNIPNVTTDIETVYAINKGQNYIGLATQVGIANTAGDGLFFHGNGSNDFEYVLESNHNQVTGNISKIISTVEVKIGAANTSDHGLSNGDIISLDVVPNSVVGLGSTAPLTLSYNEEFQKLLINRVRFNDTDVDTINNTITIENHGYKTGEKVFYDSDQPVGGLSRQCYYISKVDSSKVRFAQTLKDVQVDPSLTIDLTSTGGSDHSVALVNPPINVPKNSKLTFSTIDSSLENYELKVFYDKEFKNEFNSSQDSNLFNVSVGATTVQLSYSESAPLKLYYGLTRNGFISTCDVGVPDYSQINFVDSLYSGDYKVFGITSDTYKISPRSIPESLHYNDDQCEKLEYSTESKNVTGAIKEIKLLSSGYNYKSLPKFKSIVSDDGKNANIVALSTSIGRIKDVRILDIGYEYSSDKTLSPEAYVPPIIRIDNLDSLKSVNIINGGSEYLSSPDLIVYDPQNNKVVDETSLIAHTPHQSVSEIEVIAPVQGLNSVNHRVIAVNNSNGVGINSMTGGGSGIVTCILSTPINGFTTPPFAIGDEIFVEGIELFGESGIGTQTSSSVGVATGGDGYNSSDYQYRFFKVDDFVNSNPAVLKYNLIGLSTNPGIAKTFQSGYANIINRSNYPVLESIQERGSFETNERLFVLGANGKFTQRDVSIVDSRDDFVKVDGTFELKVGDRISGTNSNVSATVVSIIENKAKFGVDYSNRQDYGWVDDIGKISEDFQVIENNDYYQNLSYSVKSDITWDQFVDPVNRLVHPSGLKNFADVGITSSVQTDIIGTQSSDPLVILDVVGERRVDTINNIDFVTDYDSRETKSKFIQFENLKLTDYTKCKTNRVLLHDDISPRFSSKGIQDLFTEVEEITSKFSKYLIQITDPDTFDTQVSEIAVLTTTNDAFLVDKASDFTNMRLGDFTAEADSFGRKTLQFVPTDKYDKDHDIKVLKTYFNTDSIIEGTKQIGSIDLVGKNVGIGTTTVGFTTTTIAEFDATDFNSLHASLFVQNDVTKKINYSEVIVDFDGTQTHISEIYTDSLDVSYSATKVGVITARYDSGKVYLDCENDKIQKLSVNASIVGFGATSAGESGIGTHRFTTPGQPEGAERTARIETTYNSRHSGSSPITITTINNLIDSSIKGIIRVSSEDISAVHQVTVIQDVNGDAITVQYPFTAIDSMSGIGTFGTVTTGNDIVFNFYPDVEWNSSVVEVQSHLEIVNTENDFKNEPLPLQYGSVERSVFLSAYDGVNGSRANKINFDLEHENVPIYSKTFNPADTTQLDKVTGIFTIPNHFFNTNEELEYEPASTFVGVGATGVSIGQTTTNAGLTTDILPTTVFVNVIDENKFKLYSRLEYISSGVGITFTGVGEGNAHKIGMKKKLSKTVIGLDGIVQQPITFTSIKHNLENNIGAGTSQFVLSGISSVQPRDVLKIDNEYMKVEQVGFASVGLGTINDSKDVALGICTLPVVRVARGSLGISAADHNADSEVRVHRGSFNIVDSTVWFLDPPKGNTRERRSITNLPYVRAEFSGRTFLRSNYDTNMVFDDISDVFTGIGRTYTMTVGGANTTTGVGIGNGILFINGVFQTPLTINNSGNNYEFNNDTVAGISSVIFTGISSENGQKIQSVFDINQNQLPRGGLIVSMGSTPGLGYAPLVGGNVKVDLKDNSNLFTAGSLNGIVGVGTSSGKNLGIQTAAYNYRTGIITVTTNDVHGFSGDLPTTVKLKGLEFTCPTKTVGQPVTGTSYDPSTGDLTIKIVNHGLQDGDAIKFKKESLSFKCQYGVNSAHTWSGGTATNAVTINGSVQKDVTSAAYDPATGLCVMNIGTHTFTTSDTVTIGAGKLSFTCTADGGTSVKTYPRSTDPAYNTAIAIVAVDQSSGSITANVGAVSGNVAKTYPRETDPAYDKYLYINTVTPDTFKVNVLLSTTPTNTDTHTFLLASPDAVQTLNYVGVTTSIFQDHERPLFVVGIVSERSFEVNAGITTIHHEFQESPSAYAYEYYADLTTGSGYRSPVAIGVTDIEYDHKFIESTNNSINIDGAGNLTPTDAIYESFSGNLILTVGNHNLTAATAHKADTASYNPTTGKLTVTMAGHTFNNNDWVKVKDHSIVFTCGMDNDTSTHSYPRESDPISGKWIQVSNKQTNTFDLDVGTSPEVTFTPTDANYDPVTGLMELTIGSHTLRPGTHVRLLEESIKFTCDVDNNTSEKAYPRATDPYHNTAIKIESVTTNTITLKVLTNIPSSNTTKHTFKSALNASVKTGGNYTHLFASSADGGILKATSVVTVVDNSLTFTCSRDNHLGKHTYPRTTDPASNAKLGLESVTNNTITINVGSGGGGGTGGIVEATIAPNKHKFVSALPGVAYTGLIEKNADNVDYDPATGWMQVTSPSHGFVGCSTITPTTVAYNKNNGVLTITKNGHGFVVGDSILIEDNSLTFTCSKDNHTTKHHYPRPTDYASGRWLTITNKTINTFKVNVNPNPSDNKFDHQYTHIVDGCIYKANQIIGIATESITLTCAHDQHQTLHTYPRTTDPVHNVGVPVGKSSTDWFRVNVGKSPAGTGGALDFTIKNAGGRYVNPQLQVEDPVYENLPVVGVSRLGIGLTADTGENLLVNLSVGAAATTVGTARSMFEISDFKIARPGHSFKIGDKFKPIGLVHDKRLQKPLQEFELEVVETFSDFFSAWQFGELDFIDSVGSLQNGVRKRFPLFFNGQLLSFEIDETAKLSSQIDLNAVLLIFVNGVLQTPNISYQFQGGTTFVFTEAPMDSDKVDIFFYKGQDGVDIEIVNVTETLKVGDSVRIRKHPKYLDENVDPYTETQETGRIIKEILGSDLIETTIYNGPGINEVTPKPLEWTKQKVDRWIKGDLISKSRETIEPQVYPTARIIGDVKVDTGTTAGVDDGIFVDDAESFFYEEGPLHLSLDDRYGINIISVDALMMPSKDAVSAGFTAIVNNSGQIGSLDITNVGSGYTDGNNYQLSFSGIHTSVGSGVTASATATILNGSVTGTTITNPGSGYTHSAPPQVLIKSVEYTTEQLTEIQNVQGFAGIITGISTTTGTNGHPLALKFYFYADKNATDLKVGYPVLIKDTEFNLSGIVTTGAHLPFNDGSYQQTNNRWTAAKGGAAVTSVDNNDNEIVSIGSTYLDNIYKVASVYVEDQRAEITCNILSTTDTIVGFAVSGYYDGYTSSANSGLTTSFGRISWGRIYNGKRSSNPISIGVTGLTVDAGLTTFPTIQRRNYGGLNSLQGLRNTGAIRVQI